MNLQLTISIAGTSTTVSESDSPVTIGRAPTCVVVVDNTSVSAEHGEFTFERGGWTFNDHSTYGSFIDGARVTNVRISEAVAIRLYDPDNGPIVEAVPIDATPVTSRTSSQAPGSLVALRPAHGVVRIGRSPDNDLVIDGDLTVSRRHAELRSNAGSHELIDLGSRAGTFVNGHRVDQVAVDDSDLIGIGRQVFVLRNGTLEHYVDDRATLSAVGLGVIVNGGKSLLDDVTFSAEPGQLVAVVGPSGAGKSTLLRSLVGTLRPSRGSVLYNGRDVHLSIDELRGRIGFVPQDDILHTELTTRQALGFAAELRFGEEAPATERRERVDKVIADLGLSERADLAIARLSGGQRKRASVALELLTEPALLLLDEPTSGLDPGLERSVMELLRELADADRTVLVITHAVTSLELCDRVLVLAPGGTVAYYGPPDGVLQVFGVADYPEVFRQLERDGGSMSARWRLSDAYRRYVAAVMPAHSPRENSQSSTIAASAATRSQLRTLIARYISVLRANRASSLLLLLQAPLLALVILGAFERVDFSVQSDRPPRSLLMVVIIAAIAMGLANSTREIVRELPIVRRERLVGLSLTAYIGSKAGVLGAISAAQSLVLCLIVFGAQRGPAYSVLLPSMLELSAIVFLSMFAAACLGLAVSSWVRTDAAALVLVPVLLIAQLVLSNALIDVERSPLLRLFAVLSPSYWSYAAVASSTDLTNLDRACSMAEQIGVRPPCSSLWAHDAGRLGLSITLMVVEAAIFLGITALGVRRSTEN